MLHSKLTYLHRNEINTAKWDQCINMACNSLIYPRSFYLDHMAKHWDALVWGDYEAVMPLPWNQKWGIKYLYQPAFTQQLGIFGNIPVTNALEASFLSEVQQHFRFAEIFLNYAHPATIQRSNFVLPLHRSYERLRMQYKRVLLKNLVRAKRYNLLYSNEIDYKVVMEGHKELYGHRTPHVTRDDYDRFEKLCLSVDKNELVVRAVRENDKLLAAALLLHKKNRLYLLQSVTWPEGRIKEANRFLIDRLISEFSASDNVLDFEGSDLPGVAEFYKNFGAKDEPYYFYRYNHLPWLIKWAK